MTGKDEYVVNHAEEYIYKENNNNAGTYTDGSILACDAEHEIYYLTYKCQWYTGQKFVPADVYAVVNIEDFYRNADNELSLLLQSTVENGFRRKGDSIRIQGSITGQSSD